MLKDIIFAVGVDTFSHKSNDSNYFVLIKFQKGSNHRLDNNLFLKPMDEYEPFYWLISALITSYHLVLATKLIGSSNTVDTKSFKYFRYFYI